MSTKPEQERGTVQALVGRAGVIAHISEVVRVCGKSSEAPPQTDLKDLYRASDDSLAAHACRWMANQTETGNGAVSAAERQDTRARMTRMGKATSGLPPDSKNLSPHDKEYVRRLRAIASRLEAQNKLLDTSCPKGL